MSNARTRTCIACGKQLASDLEKLCPPCNTTIHTRRPCSVPGCKHLTEPFYNYCTFHFHQLQKEFRPTRGHSSSASEHTRGTSTRQAPADRPYRTSFVHTRRRSRSPVPPPPTTTSLLSSISAKTLPTPTPEPTTLTLTEIAANVDTSKSERKVQKRKEAPTPEIVGPAVTVTVPTTVQPVTTQPPPLLLAQLPPPPPQQQRKKQQQQQSRQIGPRVIIEYECAHCSARNVVTRESHYLETCVAWAGVSNPSSSSSSSSSDLIPKSESTASIAAALAAFHEDDDNIQVERDVDAILNCKDSDECQFQVDISNAKC
jgi:hypothetical protein